MLFVFTFNFLTTSLSLAVFLSLLHTSFLSSAPRFNRRGAYAQGRGIFRWGPKNGKHFSRRDRQSCGLRRSVSVRLNRLLLESDEIVVEPKGLGYAVLSLNDTRALHVKEILATNSGGEIRVGVVDGGKRDNASIYWTTEGMKIGLANPAPLLRRIEDHQRPKVDLILGLPRPRVFDRLLPVISQSGVRSLYVVGSAKVESRYWSVHMLNPSHDRHKEGLVKLRERLKEGLTQSGDTALPTVKVVKDLKRMILNVSELDQAFPPDRYIRLVSHPSRPAQQASIGLPTIPRLFEIDPEKALSQLGAKLTNETRVVVAVGPDGGWEEPWEIERFIDQGFHPFTIGERVLLTEVAVPVLITMVNDWLDRGVHRSTKSQSVY
ncbi:hypothetical protein AAMO2058_000417600 [Amorphochlora amoebiformis]